MEIGSGMAEKPVRARGVFESVVDKTTLQIFIHVKSSSMVIKKVISKSINTMKVTKENVLKDVKIEIMWCDSITSKGFYGRGEFFVNTLYSTRKR